MLTTTDRQVATGTPEVEHYRHLLASQLRAQGEHHTARAAFHTARARLENARARRSNLTRFWEPRMVALEAVAQERWEMMRFAQQRANRAWELAYAAAPDQALRAQQSLIG